MSDPIKITVQTPKIAIAAQTPKIAIAAKAGLEITQYGTLTVGETTTLEAGENATVSNSGTVENAVLNFGIPKGHDGTAATITIGTVTTGEPGSNASVINVGTTSAAVFDVTIPRGEQGTQGIQGEKGEKGDKGDKGDTGEPGIQGPQGEQGLQGIQGPKGDAGAGGTWGSIEGDITDQADLQTKLNAKLDADANAISAIKLQTARKIDGVNFDGTSNICTTSASPAYYQRNALFSSAKTTIASPNRLWLNIGANGYTLEGAVTLDLSLTASWDATGYETGASRAGKDFYIYACTPVSGTTPIIKLSANSTVPTGYTADNSRKIGGFHCLCVDVGTIAGHTLTGYIAGDIIPASVWDLAHRPVSEPEGMAYVDGLDLWVDIYLCSYTGTQAAGTIKTQSVYAAVTADGASTEKFHWYKYAQTFGKQKKRMLRQMEFMVASLGSNQGTNIAGSADANTAGGHIDTAGRRMISNYGLEDCCGFLNQWGLDAGGGNSGGSFANAYDANDTNVGGQHYMASNRVRLGGAWDYGAQCGSRFSAWNNGPLHLQAPYGSRGASEPLRGV